MAKQKSLKKTIKNNKKKKLNLKNIDFKKNWKKLTYSGALALLLFASVGFGGYTYLSNKNLEAEAYSWTGVYSKNGVNIYACKSGTTGVSGHVRNLSGRSVTVIHNGSPTTIYNGSSRIYSPRKTPWGGVYVDVNGATVRTVDRGLLRWC